MTWFLRVTALVIAVGVSLPLLAQDVKKPDAEKKDDKKADDKKADDKKPDDKPDMKKDDEKDKKDKLLPAGTVQGKVTKFDEEKRTMKVEITHSYQKLNEGEAKAYTDAMNAYRTAMTQPGLKPQDRMTKANQAQTDMRTHYSKLYTVEKKTEEVELSIMDDAKIRVAFPPIAFDDDGKAKKYTKAELDKLKGDPKLPGYPAEISQIATGVQVQVMLVKKKETKPTKPVKPEPGAAPKPKDLVGEDALADHLPQASVVVIMPAMDDPKK